jgi:hypothetical protein
MDTKEVTLGPAVKFTSQSDANVVAIGTPFNSDGSWVTSQNQEFVLICQTDGNLVLYRVIGNPPKDFAPGAVFTGHADWATDTAGNTGGKAVLQDDGNLVVLDSQGNPKWASHTSDIKCIGLFIQNDGNVVIYKSSPAWASIKS